MERKNKQKTGYPLRMPNELEASLKSFCNSNNVPMSQVICESIREYLKNNQQENINDV